MKTVSWVVMGVLTWGVVQGSSGCGAEPSRVDESVGEVPLEVQTACCKTCTTGKACGDTCISKSYTCHVAPGCACNADLCLGVACPAPDQCHDTGACDPATGACSNPPKPNGAACDDGQIATSNDVCAGGVCAGSAPSAKNAMTWSLLSSASSGASSVYVLPGSDAITNGYQGDTSTDAVLPVLCINKNNPPDPGVGVIGSPVQTPGGAWRRTWSGGTVALTSPVKGTTLTSLTVANALCTAQLGAGYRMAEHHDGDPNLWSGWDFWAAALGASLSPFQGTRFWVSINDQNANPW